MFDQSTYINPMDKSNPKSSVHYIHNNSDNIERTKKLDDFNNSPKDNHVDNPTLNGGPYLLDKLIFL
jgi:hypothetical protein